jgi:imidazolonepropionase-like amidohydrolase
MSPAQAVGSDRGLDSTESKRPGKEVESLQRVKYADLLPVDGNPTVDIWALTRVKAAFKRGQQVR